MSLRQIVAVGAAWTITAGLFSRFVGLVGTLIITRFLAPDVMGEVTAATVLAFAASWVTLLGFNQYVILRARDDPASVFQASSLSLLLVSCALVLVIIAAPHFSEFFNAPHLATYLPGMALVVFIRRIGSTPDKLLLRQMRFRVIAVATGLGEISYAVLAVTLVTTTSLGGSAIVIANIVQALVLTTITFIASGAVRLPVTGMAWRKSKELLRFGLPLGIQTTLYEFARYGDKLLFARLFGTARTGEYGLAFNLADLPATYVGEQVSNVLLPALLHVEDKRRIPMLTRAIGLLTLVTFPMSVGLGAIAHTLVEVLLSDQWQGVAPFLVVLATLSVFRPINGLLSQYLITAQRNTALLAMEMLRVVLLFGGLLLLSMFGPVVASVAVGLAGFGHTCGLLYAVNGDGRLLRGILAEVRVPVLASAIMVGAVLGLRYCVGPVHDGGEVMLLAGEIVVGVVSYATGMFLFGRAASLEVISLARGALRSRAA